MKEKRGLALLSDNFNNNANNTKFNFFSQIPDEIAHEITSKLPLTAFPVMAGMNKRFHHIIENTIPAPGILPDYKKGLSLITPGKYSKIRRELNHSKQQAKTLKNFQNSLFAKYDPELISIPAVIFSEIAMFGIMVKAFQSISSNTKSSANTSSLLDFSGGLAMGMSASVLFGVGFFAQNKVFEKSKKTKTEITRLQDEIRNSLYSKVKK